MHCNIFFIKHFITLTLIFSCIAIGNETFAATISLAPAKTITGSLENINSIIIDGEIVKGDAIKLRDILSGKSPLQVVLNSHGGDVAEAIRMGELISATRLTTRVQYKGICVSACFFLWVNGAERSPLFELGGSIGLHRPFLTTPENTNESLNQQTDAMRFIAKYLENKNVPRYLIDAMLAHSSNEVFWLKKSDVSAIGVVRPELKELYISKCGQDSESVGNASIAAYERKDFTTMNILNSLRDKIHECEWDLDYEARKLARQKFKVGWMPKISF